MFDISQNFINISVIVVALLAILYFFINYQVSVSIIKQFNILNKKKYKKLNSDNKRLAKLRKLQAQREIIDSYVDPEDDNEDDIINDNPIDDEEEDDKYIQYEENENDSEDEKTKKKYVNKKRLSKHDVLQRDLIR